MQNSVKSWVLAVLAVGLIGLAVQPILARKGKGKTEFSEVMARMNDTAKKLKTVSANLAYTTFTVLVNDKSTETGQLFYERKGKNTDIRININKPDTKVMLLRKNKAEIFLPKINQVQEYDLAQKSDLVQQFLLLGFGSEINDLKKSYDIKNFREEDLDGDTAAVLELTPRKESTAAQLTKIELWISEDSWLPVQQKFYERGGDYLIARYTGMKVNLNLPGGTFDLHDSGAKHVKMN
jgi:outer membrane lipoprotein-sorting protein